MPKRLCERYNSRTDAAFSRTLLFTNCVGFFCAQKNPAQKKMKYHAAAGKKTADCVSGCEEIMTTTITLPDRLVEQLEQQAAARHRSVEALVIEYVEAALSDETTDEEESLEALVARIKAMPPNPASIIPAQGNLAEVLRDMIAGEPDEEVLAALAAAERELRAINRADDIAEGRL